VPHFQEVEGHWLHDPAQPLFDLFAARRGHSEYSCLFGLFRVIAQLLLLQFSHFFRACSALFSKRGEPFGHPVCVHGIIQMVHDPAFMRGIRWDGLHAPNLSERACAARFI
jgi:hypothetical protein